MAIPLHRLAVPRRPAAVLSRAGLTLLEVMVALVILGLVATGFLETFAGSVRGNVEARSWAQALVYAEEGQELIEVAGTRDAIRGPALGDGFTRAIAVGPWQPGVNRATVTVTLPDGARFSLDRLVPAP